MKDYTTLQDKFKKVNQKTLGKVYSSIQDSDEIECSVNSVSSQNETICPSAAAGEPADGQIVNNVSSENYPSQTNHKSMAESVTRHASTPSIEAFHVLLCGIDSLDLGLYVIWGSDWKRRLHTFNKKKQLSRKQGGLLINLPSGRICNFRPNGKGENYRFHMQFEAYNLFIGISARPGSSPNVYLSINSKTLWQNGIETALSWITEDLKTIGGGSIQFVKVSRVDFCADFWIPGGLSYEFLVSHKVTRNDKSNLWLDKNDAETYYVGDKKSPIQLRMYNKGAEVKKEGGKKLWFQDLWQRESTEDIWRTEFEIKRPALKQFGINSLDDLKEKKAGLWRYLTSKWVSLRLLDNEKAERRTIHPLWYAVQECFQQNTPDSEIKRVYRSAGAASPEWHLSHIDGCLTSLAAQLGITNRDDALHELQIRLNRRNNDKDFKTACIKKAIQRGTLSNGDNR